jgi:hypothetical protein
MVWYGMVYGMVTGMVYDMVYGTVADTLRNIGGARAEGTEKFLNLNRGNGICSILRTHVVKN